MKRVSSLLVLIAIGCHNDRAALYESDDDATTRDAAMAPQAPPLPALPDDDRQADCKRCALSVDACVQARANCLQDDACTAELGCKGTCRNPACLQTCSAEYGWSPWYVDYVNCVFGRCPTECNTGANWQCERTYDWPAAERASFDVVFRFATPPTFFLGGQFGNGLLGATVRACSDDRECAGSALDEGAVGIDSSVTLELQASTLPPKDFRGYLEVDGGSGHPGDRVYMEPLAREMDYFAGFLPVGSFSGSPPFDASRPRVVAYAVDCLSAPVAGVQVSLSDFPEVPAFGYTNQGEWPEGPTTPTGIAVLVDLPDAAADRRVRVHAVREHAQDLVAERSIWVRPGYTTHLLLLPRTRTD